MLGDGMNAFSPEYQEEEFLNGLVSDVRECLAAYGCRTYVEMLGTNEAPGPWFPMYSFSEMLTQESMAGRVWDCMKSVKNEYLPRVVMTEDFDAMWQQYMQSYKACQPEIFFDAMQQELERRINISK